MGSNGNTQHSKLQPYPTELGIFPDFIARQPEPLVLKERIMSLSGNTFSIKTVDGRAVVQVTGKYFSLSGRKDVLDMQGNLLFTIRRDYFSMHGRFYGEDPSGKCLFEVKGKFGLHPKAICRFTSTSGKQETLCSKGNYWNTHVDITDEATGQLVATIEHKLHARQLLTGQQKYTVTVAPNVDMALIIAMCICVDEKRAGSGAAGSGAAGSGAAAGAA